MTPEPSVTFSELADVLGLTYDDAVGRLSRAGRGVELPDEVNAALADDSPVARHCAYGVLFGVRLALDYLACEWSPEIERPAMPERVYHTHEIPSRYGERLPRIVPSTVVDWFEALTGAELIREEWLIEGLELIYVLETGLHLHAITDAEVARLDFDRAKLVDDARHALFYDSYKLRPREVRKSEAGKVRIFRTVEGLGASRAMLMPDYDYDAAREQGCFTVPCRDVMIIGRPTGPERADEIEEQVREASLEVLDEARFPLSTAVFGLTDTSASLRGWLHLPGPDDEDSRLPRGCTSPGDVRIIEEAQ